MLLPPPTMSMVNLFYLENTSFKNQLHSWLSQTAIQSVPYTKASGKAEVWKLKFSPLSAPQARPEAATTKRKGSMPRGKTFLFNRRDKMGSAEKNWTFSHNYTIPLLHSTAHIYYHYICQNVSTPPHLPRDTDRYIFFPTYFYLCFNNYLSNCFKCLWIKLFSISPVRLLNTTCVLSNVVKL